MIYEDQISNQMNVHVNNMGCQQMNMNENICMKWTALTVNINAKKSICKENV